MAQVITGIGALVVGVALLVGAAETPGTQIWQAFGAGVCLGLGFILVREGLR